MELGIDGRSVLVTGGSGGIGQAIVRTLAREGARVVVHYRSQAAEAEALAAEVAGVALGADLTDEDEVAALVEGAVAAFGRLDAVVANAGVWPSEPLPLWELDLERWRRTIDVDLTGTFLTVRGFLRHVAADPAAVEAPAIVLVGSTAGTYGEAGHADYAAAKGALQHGLLRSLKNELADLHPRGRANAVAPGWVATPMTAERLTEEAIERATATMALRKVATPEDVAAAVAWLLSPVAAGHVTGELVTIAGGMEGRLLHPPSARPEERS
ncbi:MAG: SDR family oxidoreductase [Actinobacteria bacterium]|nr:SDR family oxidoreductase [Actinomycetota bacterium]